MTELIQQIIYPLSGFIRPYLGEIAMALVATVLVVYGDSVNKLIKRQLSPYHFIVRTIGFVLVCAFGYGAFIVFATPYLKQLLLMLPSLYLAPTTLGLFAMLGILAERKRYI